MKNILIQYKTKKKTDYLTKNLWILIENYGEKLNC